MTAEITTILQDDERQPWHQPEIQRLNVSLDTASDTGSGPDALDETAIG